MGFFSFFAGVGKAIVSAVKFVGKIIRPAIKIGKVIASVAQSVAVMTGNPIAAAALQAASGQLDLAGNVADVVEKGADAIGRV